MRLILNGAEMNYAQKYVELVRNKLEASNDRTSDYRISQVLGVSQTTVYNWKQGRNGIGIIDGYRIAQFLEEDALTVVSELHLDPFKEPEIQDFFGLVLDQKTQLLRSVQKDDT